MNQIVITKVKNGYFIRVKYDSYNTKDEMVAANWQEVLALLKEIGPSATTEKIDKLSDITMKVVKGRKKTNAS